MRFMSNIYHEHATVEQAEQFLAKLQIDHPEITDVEVPSQGQFDDDDSDSDSSKKIIHFTKNQKESLMRASIKQADLNLSTAEEALDFAKASWTANDMQILTADGKIIDSHKALVRSDSGEVLSVVGMDYTAAQNIPTFSMFDVLARERGMRYVRAELWGKGERVMLQARVGVGEVKLGDVVENRLTMINGFTGRQKLVIRSTFLRLKCLNGLVVADPTMSTYYATRHTTHVLDRYEEAIKLFAQSQNTFQKFLATSKQLTQKQYDKEMVKRFLNDVFGDEKNESTRIRNQKNECFVKAVNGQGNGDGSLWSLYNGVTEWVDHVKGEGREGSYSLADGGSKIKENAFTAATALLLN